MQTKYRGPSLGGARCERLRCLKARGTRRREKLGILPTVRVREDPAQAKLERGTLKSSLEV
jgi:hypothetical protein